VFSEQVDAVISRLCPLFSQQADDILDLRNCARLRVRPGLCVSCYFRLFAEAAPALQTVLYPLRAWLESNIEVVAKDSNAVILERLPLALDSPDLPSLCYQLMDEFRDNRVYSTDVLNLEFRYKQAA
jgi:hypothetical protein